MDTGNRLEPRLRGASIGFFAALAVSGFATLVSSSPSSLTQLVQLAHAALGCVAMVVFILYLVVHVVQTRSGLSGAARAIRLRWFGLAALIGVIVGGGLLVPVPKWQHRFDTFLVTMWLALPARLVYLVFRLIRGKDASPFRTGELGAIAVLFSGLSGATVMVGAGVYSATHYPPWTFHVLSGVALAPLVLIHVVSANRWARLAEPGVGSSYTWRGPLLRIAAPLATLLLAVVWFAARRAEEALDPPVVDQAAILPLETGFAQDLTTECRYCHPEVVEGWRVSSHALAAVDPVFTALVRTLYTERGPAAARYCLGCHAPHALDPVRSSSFDEVVRSEGYGAGVHCLSCHRSTPGPGHGNGSFKVEPLGSGIRMVTESRLLGPPHAPLSESKRPPDWRGATRSLLFEGGVDSLVFSRIEPHRQRFRFSSREAVSCLPCHVQTLGIPTAGRSDHVIQDQYDSWVRSPFAARGEDCARCHMPQFLAPDDYPVSDHRFLAANTYLASLAGGDAQVAIVTATLAGGIQPPGPPIRDPLPPVHPPGKPLLTIEARLDTYASAPRVVLRTTSTGGIGHSFPNGPTDLVEVWMAIEVRDATGRVLVDDGRAGRPGSIRLGHTFIDSDGRAVDDHRLWAVYEVIDRGSVPPEGSLETALSLPAGELAKPLRVQASWLYRRLDPELVVRLTGAPSPGLPIATVASFEGSLD